MYTIVELLIFQTVIFSLNVVRSISVFIIVAVIVQRFIGKTNKQVTAIDLYSVRVETVYTVFKTPRKRIEH